MRYATIETVLGGAVCYISGYTHYMYSYYVRLYVYSNGYTHY